MKIINDTLASCPKTYHDKEYAYLSVQRLANFLYFWDQENLLCFLGVILPWED